MTVPAGYDVHRLRPLPRRGDFLEPIADTPRRGTYPDGRFPILTGSTTHRSCRRLPPNGSSASWSISRTSRSTVARLIDDPRGALRGEVNASTSVTRSNLRDPGVSGPTTVQGGVVSWRAHMAGALED